jgi:hypothetical protein
MNRTRNLKPLHPLALAVLLLLLGACSRPTPVPLIFNAAPWQSGEQHVFAITDKDGKPAGTATYTVTGGENDAGEKLWSMERVVNSQGAVETVTVKVSEQGFRPASSYLERTSAAGTESVDALYTGSQVDLTLITRQNNMSVQRSQIPSDARETATLPLIVRALPLAQGYATQLNSFLPVAELLDRVTVRVAGEEEVTVPAGNFKSWIVELDTGDAVTRMWIAQTPPYPVVKFVEGRNQAEFELAQFRPRE